MDVGCRSLQVLQKAAAVQFGALHSPVVCVGMLLVVGVWVSARLLQDEHHG